MGLCEGGQGGEKGGRDIGGVSRINAGCKFFSLVFLFGRRFFNGSVNMALIFVWFGRRFLNGSMALRRISAQALPGSEVSIPCRLYSENVPNLCSGASR